MRNSLSPYLLILSFFLIPLPLSAVPDFLNHQGRILGADANPLTGVSDVTFSMYTSETGGSSEWSEVISVAFDDGYYSVTLGESTSLSVDTLDQNSLYLEISIDGAEFAPRHKLTAVPYAVVSGEAQSVKGPVYKTDGSTVIDGDGVWQGTAIQYTDLTGTPSGTANQIIKFIDENTLGDSVIYESDDGKIGIGTTDPAVQLHLTGAVAVGDSSGDCETGMEGVIRWSGSAFEGCDGTEWISLSGGSGGQASIPQLGLSTTRVDFGDGSNGAQTVTVTNIGAEDATSLIYMASDGFTISDNTCGETLASGEACEITVDLVGTIRGLHEGTLIIASNNGATAISAMQVEIQLVSFTLLVNSNPIDSDGNFEFEETASVLWDTSNHAEGSASLSNNVYGASGGSPADWSLISVEEDTLWSLHPSVGDFEFQWSYRHTGDSGWCAVMFSNTDVWADTTRQYCEPSTHNVLPDGWFIGFYWGASEFYFNTSAGLVFWPYDGYHSNWKTLKFTREGNTLEFFVNGTSKGTRQMPNITDDGAHRLIVSGSSNGGQSSYGDMSYSTRAQMDNIQFRLTDPDFVPPENIAPEYTDGLQSGMVSHNYGPMTDGQVTVNTGQYKAYFPASNMPASLGLRFEGLSPIVQGARFHSTTTAARPRYFKVEYSDNGSDWTKAPATGWTDGASQYNSDEAEASNEDAWQGVTFSPVQAEYWRFTWHTAVYNNGNNNAGMDEFEFIGVLP